MLILEVEMEDILEGDYHSPHSTKFGHAETGRKQVYKDCWQAPGAGRGDEGPSPGVFRGSVSMPAP